MATFTCDPHGHMTEAEVRKRCRELSRLAFRLQNMLVMAVTEHADACACDACRWVDAHVNKTIGAMRAQK